MRIFASFILKREKQVAIWNVFSGSDDFIAKPHDVTLLSQHTPKIQTSSRIFFKSEIGDFWSASLASCSTRQKERSDDFRATRDVILSTPHRAAAALPHFLLLQSSIRSLVLSIGKLWLDKVRATKVGPDGFGLNFVKIFRADFASAYKTVYNIQSKDFFLSWGTFVLLTAVASVSEVIVIFLQLFLLANIAAFFCSLLGLVSYSFWEGDSGDEMSTRWRCFETINHLRDAWLVLRNDGAHTRFPCL